MKFTHIGVKVMDMAASIKFYEDVLGAKVTETHESPAAHLVFLEIAGTVVELIYKPDNEVRTMGPIEHIAFKVDDLEAEIARLESMGIAHTVPRVVATGEIVFFDGPNNEKFEFVGAIRM